MSLREQLKMCAVAEANVANPFYTTKHHATALCVETSGGEVWVLPWHHFVFGRYEAGEPERLVLTFVTHEVLLCGLNLGEMVPEIANQRVEHLRTAPEKYLKAAGAKPSIGQILVRPLAEPAVTA